jgi:hypothetical protein
MLLAFTLAPAAPAATPDHLGRIYSHVRSNIDGSEAERVYVYRASGPRIEVAEMRTRCRNAAFVTAELDLVRGEATRLVAGRLRPNAGHEEFGLMTYEGAARRVGAVVTLPKGESRDPVAVPEVGGPAFGSRGGPIWFDAAGGHIIEARWGIPDHAEYRDFGLRLTRVSDGGATAWRRLLTRQFENCPAAGE